MLVHIALQEDVDCMGLSILSGAHNTLMPEIVELPRGADASDIFVFGGGIIPEDDIPSLLERGVVAVFTPGTPTTEVVGFLERECARRLEALDEDRVGGEQE